ncbi:hypothetical protein PF004_g23781 [Phytophthora fragariae]|nr:hypothetical protein PF004_g23781 [Phytophthora fragariae]
MALYEYGTDINFLNATSLTRAFDQLLCRFSCFYYMPPPSSRGLPPKLRYLHQVELARMVNKREPLLTHTFGFIDGATAF